MFNVEIHLLSNSPLVFGRTAPFETRTLLYRYPNGDLAKEGTTFKRSIQRKVKQVDRGTEWMVVPAASFFGRIKSGIVLSDKPKEVKRTQRRLFALPVS